MQTQSTCSHNWEVLVESSHNDTPYHAQAASTTLLHRSKDQKQPTRAFASTAGNWLDEQLKMNCQQSSFYPSPTSHSNITALKTTIKTTTTTIKPIRLHNHVIKVDHWKQISWLWNDGAKLCTTCFCYPSYYAEWTGHCDKQMSHLQPTVVISVLELISGNESQGYT